jgi:hypothetical protein
MAQPIPPLTLLVKEGGNFVFGALAGAVGPRDYVEKTNFRRLDDAEVRREGTILFKPNAGLEIGTQPFNISPIVGMWEAVRPNGDRSIVLLTATSVYKFVYSTGTWISVGTGYASTLEWQVESLDGYLIFNNKIDLPFTFRQEDATTVPIYEMRDIGIASVGTICVYNGFLMCADVTEIAAASLAGWMAGGTPYGIPGSGIVNRIRYKIIWSDYKLPRSWAPLLTGTIQSANKFEVTLAYPAPYSFPVGTKLAVIGAGPAGGTLGGQVGIDDGVAVTTVTGAVLTLGTTANVSLTYPLTVQVTRFADVSTFVGSSSIKDDSSAITLMKPLKRGLVVYRETGVFIGRYTAQVETPFLFTPEWSGRNIPTIPRAVADINGDYHLYPSNGRFYMFDGAGEPRIHRPMDDVRGLFSAGLTSVNQYLAWCKNNPVTKETWFFCPNGVVAFDHVASTTSWIDETYTAAAYVRKPNTDDFWFILAKSAQVLQYGALETGPVTYLRLGVPMVSSIKFGISSLGDDTREKVIHSYMPLFAVGSSDFRLWVLLDGGDNYSRPLTPLFDTINTTPASLPRVETFFRNIYFQDEIQVVDTADIGVSFVGRSFSFSRIQSSGVTRGYNGNS